MKCQKFAKKLMKTAKSHFYFKFKKLVASKTLAIVLEIISRHFLNVTKMPMKASSKTFVGILH